MTRGLIQQKGHSFIIKQISRAEIEWEMRRLLPWKTALRFVGILVNGVEWQ